MCSLEMGRVVPAGPPEDSHQIGSDRHSIYVHVTGEGPLIGYDKPLGAKGRYGSVFAVRCLLG